MQVNGWELFAHPLLLDQLEKLMAAVEKEKGRKRKGNEMITMIMMMEREKIKKKKMTMMLFPS